MELEEAVLMSFNSLTHELSGIKDAIKRQSLQMQKLEQSTSGEFEHLKNSVHRLNFEVGDLKMEMKRYNLNRQMMNLRINRDNDELKKEIEDLKEIIANCQRNNKLLHCGCTDVKVLQEAKLHQSQPADSPDVEFVSESQVTSEELNEAQRLCLPPKFFAYRQLPLCECDQCVKENEYFKGTMLEDDFSNQANKYYLNEKEESVLNPSMTSGLTKSATGEQSAGNTSMNLSEHASSGKSRTISPIFRFGSSSNGDSQMKRNMANNCARLRDTTTIDKNAFSIGMDALSKTRIRALPLPSIKLNNRNDSSKTTRIKLTPKSSLKNW